MITTNATNFRKNIFSLLEKTIKYNEPIRISAKNGNAVMISREDYNGLMETLYLCSAHNINRIIEGLDTPVEDCVSEDEIKW